MSLPIVILEEMAGDEDEEYEDRPMLSDSNFKGKKPDNNLPLYIMFVAALSFLALVLFL